MKDDRREKMTAMLRKAKGQLVVLHLVRNGESTIQQGVVDREDEELGTFVLGIDRIMREHPETREVLTMPQSETEFFPEDVFYLQRQLETEDEAQAAISRGDDGPRIIPGSSGAVGGGYGGLQ